MFRAFVLSGDYAIRLHEHHPGQTEIVVVHLPTLAAFTLNSPYHQTFPNSIDKIKKPGQWTIRTGPNGVDVIFLLPDWFDVNRFQSFITSPTGVINSLQLTPYNGPEDRELIPLRILAPTNLSV